MNGVLVDTSVWIDHFRHRSNALVELLRLDLVMTHPLVIGEIACGTPPKRVQILSDLKNMQPVQRAAVEEAMALVERERLFGPGCGLIDLLLTSSPMTPGVRLWTLDQRLSALAKRFGVDHRPDLH